MALPLIILACLAGCVFPNSVLSLLIAGGIFIWGYNACLIPKGFGAWYKWQHKGRIEDAISADEASDTEDGKVNLANLTEACREARCKRQRRVRIFTLLSLVILSLGAVFFGGGTPKSDESVKLAQKETVSADWCPQGTPKLEEQVSVALEHRVAILTARCVKGQWVQDWGSVTVPEGTVTHAAQEGEYAYYLVKYGESQQDVLRIPLQKVAPLKLKKG